MDVQRDFERRIRRINISIRIQVKIIFLQVLKVKNNICLIGKTMRLNKVLRELNISLDRAVEYLADKGHEIEARPTTKISGDVYQVLTRWL